MAELIIFRTNLSGDGKSRRHWHTNTVHFGKVGTFTTEELFHICPALGLSVSKCVNTFFTHNCFFCNILY